MILLKLLNFKLNRGIAQGISMQIPCIYSL